MFTKLIVSLMLLASLCMLNVYASSAAAFSNVYLNSNYVANNQGSEAPPTEGPTGAPTEGPTGAPTEGPTAGPTEGPTGAPTEGPTGAPTEEPTGAPTEGPTGAPTEEPTGAPTEGPTGAPTGGPTEGPTEAPTEGPTEGPTKAPTAGPTAAPTGAPTVAPTQGPAPTLGQHILDALNQARNSNYQLIRSNGLLPFQTIGQINRIIQTFRRVTANFNGQPCLTRTPANAGRNTQDNCYAVIADAILRANIVPGYLITVGERAYMATDYWLNQEQSIEFFMGPLFFGVYKERRGIFG
ncbi:alpha-amylase-like [Oppia nitens]|uniref:alpha-amylase-like n=1 Tax=Oppia nitens TaxID=1686743 RepID=UPI0023DBC7B4|nr:alpha-amylase-like [Oppia nitens]